jgi:hypothetical protein
MLNGNLTYNYYFFSQAAAAGQADFGEYPWQAVLLGPADLYIGSGVLIDNLHVLTAAHKLTNYT